MRIFIYFIISLANVTFCFGQEVEETDSIVQKVPKKFLSGLNISADAGKLLVGQLTDFEDKWRVSANLLLFESLQVSGEFGSATITPNDAFENVLYEVNGDFLRYGLDYVTKIKNDNFLSLGFRRATANYSDEATIFIASGSNLSSNFVRTFSRPNLEASWWELVLSSETRLVKINESDEDVTILQQILSNVFIGLDFRLRFNLIYDIQQDTIDTYTIPGYGRTFDNSTPAVNLFIKYRISF